MFTLHLLSLNQASVDSELLKKISANDICQRNSPNHKAVQKKTEAERDDLSLQWIVYREFLSCVTAWRNWKTNRL